MGGHTPAATSSGPWLLPTFPRIWRLHLHYYWDAGSCQPARPARPARPASPAHLTCAPDTRRRERRLFPCLLTPKLVWLSPNTSLLTSPYSYSYFLCFLFCSPALCTSRHSLPLTAFDHGDTAHCARLAILRTPPRPAAHNLGIAGLPRRQNRGSYSCYSSREGGIIYYPVIHTIQHDKWQQSWDKSEKRGKTRLKKRERTRKTCQGRRSLPPSRVAATVNLRHANILFRPITSSSLDSAPSSHFRRPRLSTYQPACLAIHSKAKTRGMLSPCPPPPLCETTNHHSPTTFGGTQDDNHDKPCQGPTHTPTRLSNNFAHKGEIAGDKSRWHSHRQTRLHTNKPSRGTAHHWAHTTLSQTTSLQVRITSVVRQ